MQPLFYFFTLNHIAERSLGAANALSTSDYSKTFFMQKNTRIMKAVAKATALAALMTLIFLGNVTAQTAKTATAPAVQQKGILNVAAVQNSDKTWGYELKANNKVVFKMVAAGGSTRGFATREIALSYGNVAGSRIENDAATMSNLNTTAAEKLLGFRSAAIQ